MKDKLFWVALGKFLTTGCVQAALTTGVVISLKRLRPEMNTSDLTSLVIFSVLLLDWTMHRNVKLLLGR